MNLIIRKAMRSLLSAVLVISALTLLSFNPIPQKTTTLALVYDELASVFACGLSVENIKTIPHIHTLTTEVAKSQANAKIKAYSECQGIVKVYEDSRSTMTLIPIDQYYTKAYQWNLTDIGLEAAWDITTGSADVIVAVVDTGVNTTNGLTDFGTDGVILGAYFQNGTVQADTTLSQYTDDKNSHGTAVASLIAANMNSQGITGIAPDVKIMPIKVFRDPKYTNEQVSASNTDIAAGIIWAVDHGADIINMSLGGPTSDSALANAVRYADEHGVLLVAASGNDSDLNQGTIAKVSYPAAYPEVIAVGSLTQATKVSNFSNVLGQSTGVCDGDCLDLSAYGENILLPWVTNDSYGFFNGTSFSSPTVAGVLALMKSVYPDLTPEQGKAILLSGVTDIDGDIYSPGWDVWTGYGMVNALQTLVQASDFETYSDGNTSVASAEFIYGHHPYTAALRPVFDQDYFAFTLYEPDTVTITVSTSSIQDLMFDVSDGTNMILSTVDDGGSGQTETATISDLQAGTYVVHVSDYAGRAYLSDYTIEVDYASKTLPLISASTSEGVLMGGQSTLLAVQLSVIESLYHTITATKDGIAYPVPTDLLFTEWGSYTMTVDDVLYDPVTFSFSIVPPEGYKPHLSVSLIGLGGTINLTSNGSALLSESDVDQGTPISINLDLLPNYRLYRWAINGVIQPSSVLPIDLTINQMSLTITLELGLTGDLNLTDDVTTTDLVLLRRYLAGLETLDPKAVFNSDLNADASVTTTDLVKLRRFLAGLE